MDMTDKELDALAEQVRNACEALYFSNWQEVARVAATAAARWAAEKELEGEVMWQYRSITGAWLGADATNAARLEAEGVPVRAIRVVAATPQAGPVIGPEWRPCRKRPVVVHVREQRPGEQHVSTREGITPAKPDDLIMRGVEGEEYPIGRDLFNRTYDLVADEAATPQADETKCWQHRPGQDCPAPDSCRENGCSAVERELFAAATPQAAQVPEDAVTRLAIYLAEKDGHDPHALILDGYPPEPWGEAWNRYEPDARAMLAAAQPQGVGQ